MVGFIPITGDLSFGIVDGHRSGPGRGVGKRPAQRIHKQHLMIRAGCRVKIHVVCDRERKGVKPRVCCRIRTGIPAFELQRALVYAGENGIHVRCVHDGPGLHISNFAHKFPVGREIEPDVLGLIRTVGSRVNQVFSELRLIPEMICLLLGDRLLQEYKGDIMDMQFRYRRSKQRNLHQVHCPRDTVTKAESEVNHKVNCNFYEIEHIQIDILIQGKPFAFHDIPCHSSEIFHVFCIIIFGFCLNAGKQTQIGCAECGKIQFQRDLEAQFCLCVGRSLEMIA